MAPRINIRDDQLYTNPLPGGSWLIGGQSSADAEPTAFSRESVLEYIQAELAAVASSGSASDLTTGTLPLGRLHAHLQQISNIAAPESGGILYFDADTQQFDVLPPGPSGRFLKALGDGANPVWDTASSSSLWVSCADYGVTGDGVTNDTAAINAFLAYCAANNRTAFFPDGTYLCGNSAGAVNNGQINLVSGLRVECALNARFVKNFRSTGVTGFLGQSSYTTKISDVIWTGGQFSVPDNTVLTYSGNMVGVYGDDLIFRHLIIDGFGGTGGGRAYAVAGDRIHIINPIARNPNPATGNGGIRVLAGDQFLCLGGYVESGDDCFQFVPTNAVSTAVFADSDITNGAYIGCTGYSYEARLCIVAVGNQTGEVGDPGFPTCEASITDCSFISIKGVGAGKAAIVQNTDSTGQIKRITFTNCTFGGSVDASLTGTLSISGWRCGGGVDSIDFNGCSIVNAALTALVIDGYTNSGGLPAINNYNVSNVHWDGGRLEAPADGTAFAVKINGARTVSFENMVISANGNEAVQIGQGAVAETRAYNVAFDQVAFEGIADGQYGIKLQYAESTSLTKCSFVSASGATDARAVFNGTAGGYYTTVRDCDMSRLVGTSSLFIGNPFANGSTFDNCRPLANPDTALFKTGDETRANTTTLANDTHITGLTALPNSTYRLTGVIPFDEGGGGGNFKFALVLTGAGASMEYVMVNHATLASQTARTTSGTAISSTALNRRVAVIEGFVTTGNFAATIDLQWAQNTSNGTGATVYQGAFLSLKRLG